MYYIIASFFWVNNLPNGKPFTFFDFPMKLSRKNI